MIWSAAPPRSFLLNQGPILPPTVPLICKCTLRHIRQPTGGQKLGVGEGARSKACFPASTAWAWNYTWWWCQLQYYNFLKVHFGWPAGPRTPWRFGQLRDTGLVSKLPNVSKKAQYDIGPDDRHQRGRDQLRGQVHLHELRVQLGQLHV